VDQRTEKTYFYTSKRLKRFRVSAPLVFLCSLDVKQLIKEGNEAYNNIERKKAKTSRRSLTLSRPYCVSFHSNIIIKTISLRKIIREISGRFGVKKLFSHSAPYERVYCYLQLYNFVARDVFFPVSSSSSASESVERENKGGPRGWHSRILAPD
jgi:hypothetical protein